MNAPLQEAAHRTERYCPDCDTWQRWVDEASGFASGTWENVGTGWDRD